MQHHLYYGLRIRLLLFRKKFGKKNRTCVLEFGAYFLKKHYIMYSSVLLFFILEREKTCFDATITYIYVNQIMFFQVPAMASFDSDI